MRYDRFVSVQNSSLSISLIIDSVSRAEVCATFPKCFSCNSFSANVSDIYLCFPIDYININILKDGWYRLRMISQCFMQACVFVAWTWCHCTGAVMERYDIFISHKHLLQYHYRGHDAAQPPWSCGCIKGATFTIRIWLNLLETATLRAWKHEEDKHIFLCSLDTVE